MVPVTSLFTSYCLAAYTHDVVRLWLLDLFDHLYSFGLVCGWRCSFRHSRFYYPVSSSGLTARVSCEEHHEIRDGLGHFPARLVPAITSTPLLVLTGCSSALVVSSSTTPMGITSGMPCYSMSVLLGHPPPSIEFLPSNHNWSGWFYNKIKNESKKRRRMHDRGPLLLDGQMCLCGMAWCLWCWCAKTIPSDLWTVPWPQPPSPLSSFLSLLLVFVSPLCSSFPPMFFLSGIVWGMAVLGGRPTTCTSTNWWVQAIPCLGRSSTRLLWRRTCCSLGAGLFPLPVPRSSKRRVCPCPS